MPMMHAMCWRGWCIRDFACHPSRMSRVCGAQIRDLDELGWVPNLRPDLVRADVRDDNGDGSGVSDVIWVLTLRQQPQLALPLLRQPGRDNAMAFADIVAQGLVIEAGGVIVLDPGHAA